MQILRNKIGERIFFSLIIKFSYIKLKILYMFPFLNHNYYPAYPAYPAYPFSINLSYDSLQQSQNDTNPYIYHFVNPNFQLQHESICPNPFQQHQLPYFFKEQNLCEQNGKHEQRKKKRITKKIVLTQVKKKIIASYPQFKAKKNMFKYFDPSRAPPITSLRNEQQLQMDFVLHQQNVIFFQSNQQKPNSSTLKAQRKLQILLQQPDPTNYCFLICKKRRNHRNIKRRYSVAYFEQRAAYIVNKKKIPAYLYPKNKVINPRTPKINAQELFDSSENQMSSEFFSSQSESIKKMQSSKKLKQLIGKVEKMDLVGIKQMKQDNQSLPFEVAEN